MLIIGQGEVPRVAGDWATSEIAPGRRPLLQMRSLRDRRRVLHPLLERQRKLALGRSMISSGANRGGIAECDLGAAALARRNARAALEPHRDRVGHGATRASAIGVRPRRLRASTRCRAPERPVRLTRRVNRRCNSSASAAPGASRALAATRSNASTYSACSAASCSSARQTSGLKTSAHARARDPRVRDQLEHAVRRRNGRLPLELRGLGASGARTRRRARPRPLPRAQRHARPIAGGGTPR